MVSVFLSFVPFPILKRTERYVQTFDADNISIRRRFGGNRPKLSPSFAVRRRARTRIFRIVTPILVF